MEAWHKTKSIVEQIPLLVPSIDELSESLMMKQRKSGVFTFNVKDVQVLREHMNIMTKVVGHVGIQVRDTSRCELFGTNIHKPLIGLFWYIFHHNIRQGSCKL